MGYLAQGMEGAFFIRMTDEITKEYLRLLSIGRRTRSKRSRKKLAKRIDGLVKVDSLEVIKR